MAELCSLENAFPNIGSFSGSPFVGGTDAKPTREERKAAKRRAKQCKGLKEETEEKEEFQPIPKPVAAFPSYFGKGMDDEEGFATYSAAPGDQPNYRLEPDFTKTFDLGPEKALGALLPDPNLSDQWKPMTQAPSIAARPGWASIAEDEPERAVESKVETKEWISKSDKNEIVEQMNSLIGRLELMEKRRLQNTQTELLLFVGTGVFLLFTFELISRH